MQFLAARRLIVAPSVLVAYPKKTPLCAVVTKTARSPVGFFRLGWLIIFVSPAPENPRGAGSPALSPALDRAVHSLSDAARFRSRQRLGRSALDTDMSRALAGGYGLLSDIGRCLYLTVAPIAEDLQVRFLVLAAVDERDFVVTYPGVSGSEAP
jgi:hypothetical protein